MRMLPSLVIALTLTSAFAAEAGQSVKSQITGTWKVTAVYDQFADGTCEMKALTERPIIRPSAFSRGHFGGGDYHRKDRVVEGLAARDDGTLTDARRWRYCRPGDCHVYTWHMS